MASGDDIWLRWTDGTGKLVTTGRMAPYVEHHDSLGAALKAAQTPPSRAATHPQIEADGVIFTANHIRVLNEWAAQAKDT